MVEIKYTTCDRCGEKINYHSRKRAIIDVPKIKIPFLAKITWIVCGYTINSIKELCDKCSEELEEFLSTRSN